MVEPMYMWKLLIPNISLLPSVLNSSSKAEDVFVWEVESRTKMILRKIWLVISKAISALTVSFLWFSKFLESELSWLNSLKWCWFWSFCTLSNFLSVIMYCNLTRRTVSGPRSISRHWTAFFLQPGWNSTIPKGTSGASRAILILADHMGIVIVKKEQITTYEFK